MAASHLAIASSFHLIGLQATSKHGLDLAVPVIIGWQVFRVHAANGPHARHASLLHGVKKTLV
jgi:hypothetical protein